MGLYQSEPERCSTVRCVRVCVNIKAGTLQPTADSTADVRQTRAGGGTLNKAVAEAHGVENFKGEEKRKINWWKDVGEPRFCPKPIAEITRPRRRYRFERWR